MSEDLPRKDAFIEMVTAKASVDLRLSDYHPRSMLVVPEHEVRRPGFPVIDYHNHLDAQDPQSVLRIMDECGLELIVNITIRVGREAFEMIRKYHTAAPKRFATYGWMDWSDLQSPDSFEEPGIGWRNWWSTAPAV
jgi:hypothetical protein